jgi:DNA-binding NarL/FixJ family response regulator
MAMPDGRIEPRSEARIRPRADGTISTTLSPRELEVMRTVVECGGSTKEAAHRLGLTRETVRNYRSIAYQRTGTSSATEFWAAMGWLRLPPKQEE